MARVRFIGDSPTCVWLGIRFTRSHWVESRDVDPADLERLKAHPHFEVADADATPPAPVSRRESRRQGG
jgi:hypothetical protein